MGIFYLAVSLFIILKHYQLVPVMFTSIFNNAFDVQAIFGVFASSCVMQFGIKRGLFSNEAVVGSARNAAASAAVPSGKTRTCADAFCIHRHYPDLLRNSVHASLFRRRADFKLAGMPWVQAAASSSLGGFGTIFITIALFALVCLYNADRKLYYAEMGLGNSSAAENRRKQ